MLNVLALDTATDACSVALSLDGEFSHHFELIPRQHSGRIFSMLREIQPDGDLAAAGIQLLAYNQGPGSFTGLRIAASAMQGLAFTSGLPVAGISTLACMAQGAWRQQLAPEDASLLVLLDARIDEVYWGHYRLEDGCALALRDDAVGSPGELPAGLVDDGRPLLAIGNGVAYLDSLPAGLRAGINQALPDVWPDSFDLPVLAERAWRQGQLQSPGDVQPVYLRNEISWKKLSEQG